MTEKEVDYHRLVAVVVTHNRLAQLKITVERLLESPPQCLHAVVIIDNHSGDGTADWLALQDDPRLVVHSSDINRGGAGGFEAGMRLARERFDPDWMVVMDDDARPYSNALSDFQTHGGGAGDAVAAAVYLPDGNICEMNRPSRNPFWHGREFLQTMLLGRKGFHLGPDQYHGQNVVDVDVTSFVGFFISRRGLDLAGYPDASLFLYADDGLYTLRLRKAGGKIGFVPSVRFEHDCSTFNRAQRGRFRPLWKAYYYHRNLLILYRAAAGPMFWPILPIIILKWFYKVLDHRGERAKFCALMVRSIRDGLFSHTDVSHDQIVRLAGDVSRAKHSRSDVNY